MISVDILDSDFILRRVPTYLPNYIKPDGSITSRAYQKKRAEDGVSVDLEKLSSFEKATLGDKRFRLLKLNAGVIRHDINDGLNTVHNPLPENDAHGLIIGHITEGKQKQLLKNSVEVIASF
jgi:hypothetical protein